MDYRRSYFAVQEALFRPRGRTISEPLPPAHQHPWLQGFTTAIGHRDFKTALQMEADRNSMTKAPPSHRPPLEVTLRQARAQFCKQQMEASLLAQRGHPDGSPEKQHLALCWSLAHASHDAAINWNNTAKGKLNKAEVASRPMHAPHRIYTPDDDADALYNAREPVLKLAGRWRP